MITTGIAVAITLLVKSAPGWLPVISDALLAPARDAFVGKLVEKGFDKSIEGGRKALRLDEKEQTRHLELALKNAAERGQAKFQSLLEQQQYGDVLATLSEANTQSDLLRREALRLFTLEAPDLAKLNALYNDALLARSQATTTPTIDATPYLSSFFDALIAELYIDPLFHDKISDVLKVRANLNMQRSLAEVVETLRQIYGTLEHGYTTEQFEIDVQAYTAHIERTLRNLKLVGVVPKERTHENRDPELDGIFVPLRISVKKQSTPNQQTRESLIDALEQSSCLVLLGGPGSGKSTVTKHLAWSHAVANLSDSTSLTNSPLLAGKPVPLRIELRRLNEDRRQRPDYDFLKYTCEVQLGRAGLNIPPQMFKELLSRRMMLILFDGLDEVATLDDRRILVDEIESFAQRYPGNRFLVTSRPVGYELAPLSGQTFSQAEVQPFNDEQIHLFLENWYVHVLRLSPLSPDDAEELETLYTALKSNPRLHDLAENPLLLTVITALHRYERLPDRRIQVYDRCADLLLETWAKLRGTNERWFDLKLSKEDQYACVAHLGFVLHQRAQEQDNMTGSPTTASTAVDVPFLFMLQEIERFLYQQSLLTTRAEEHTQARRFLELVQEEAGLIVERGTGENNEPLYGFVHRTFQEYFAAANVYERYRQEEDPQIISEFLTRRLHDPHWREVILLLFGKLGRKPATKQLRQILEGKIRSDRSEYTDIVQQDLFFVGSCLTEDIPVENELAEAIISRLDDLVIASSYLSQRSEALQTLAALTHSRQYSSLSRQNLKMLVDHDLITSTPTAIEAAATLFQNSSTSEEQQVASRWIQFIGERPDLPIEQAIQVASNLYQTSPIGSKTERFAAQLLLQLAQRPDLPVEQAIQAASNLYQPSIEDTKKRRFAAQLLLQLAQRPDLSVEQAIETAYNLTTYYSEKPEEKRYFVTQMLLQLVQNQIFTPSQHLQAIAVIFAMNDTPYSERLQAMQTSFELAQGEAICQTFEKRWKSINLNIEPQISDISLLVRFTKEELLPPEVRNDMYRALRRLVPYFDQLKDAGE